MVVSLFLVSQPLRNDSFHGQILNHLVQYHLESLEEPQDSSYFTVIQVNRALNPEVSRLSQQEFLVSSTGRTTREIWVSSSSEVELFLA